MVSYWAGPMRPGVEPAAGVGGVRIGEQQPEIIGRGPVGADEIAPLGRLLVPQALLGAMGAPSQLDPVGLDHVPADPELEAPLGLVDQDPGAAKLPVDKAEVPLDDDL